MKTIFCMALAILGTISSDALAAEKQEIILSASSPSDVSQMAQIVEPLNAISNSKEVPANGAPASVGTYLSMGWQIEFLKMYRTNSDVCAVETYLSRRPSQKLAIQYFLRANETGSSALSALTSNCMKVTENLKPKGFYGNTPAF